MLLSGMQENGVALVRPGGTMPVPTGRFEKRIAAAATVEIRPEAEGTPKVTTLTENVSHHGVRVLMDREWRPGQNVLVFFPREGVQTQAQVVYCQRLAERGFGVGLRLSVCLEL
jgi:PilZ domain-containing protein